MFDWILDMPLTYLKKDKNCKKPVKELLLEMLELRLRSKKFLRKTQLRNDFLQLFLASFVRNPEAAIRGVL